MIVCNKCKKETNGTTEKYADVLDIMRFEDYDICDNCFEDLIMTVGKWFKEK